MSEGEEPKQFTINQNTAISLSLVLSLGGYFCWDFYNRGIMEERVTGINQRLTRIERKLDTLSRATTARRLTPEQMYGHGGYDRPGQEASDHGPFPFAHAPDCRFVGLTSI